MSTERRYNIPGYFLEDKLGFGASGVVFKAKENSPMRILRAVKILNPIIGDSSLDEERFNREARILTQLAHRGIVRYVASGYTMNKPRNPYIVMDFIDGPSLSETAKQLTIDEKLAVIIEVLNALSYAHSQNVLHRDIRPLNIIIRNSDKQPVIVDFGLAFSEQLDANLTESPLGTPGYMPIEVQNDPRRSRSPKHDIYSVGATLYEIISGSLPNVQDYVPLRNLDSRYVGLDSIVQQALASEQSRFNTAEEFAEALHAWMRQDSARRQLTPSQLSVSLRDRLIAKDTIREEHESHERRKRERIVQLCQEKEPIIIESCKNGIKETFEQITDLRPNLIFAEDPDAIRSLRRTTERNMPLFPVCMIADRTADRRFVFAAARHSELSMAGHYRSRKETPFAPFPQLQHINFGIYKSVADTVWVFLSEGTTMAPVQIFQAGIALMTKDLDPLSVDFSVAICASLHFTAAQRLELPSDVKDFSISVVDQFLS